MTCRETGLSPAVGEHSERHPGAVPEPARERNLSWLSGPRRPIFRRTGASCSSTSRTGRGRAFTTLSPQDRRLRPQAPRRGQGASSFARRAMGPRVPRLSRAAPCPLADRCGRAPRVAGWRHPAFSLGILFPERPSDPDRGRGEREALPAPIFRTSQAGLRSRSPKRDFGPRWSRRTAGRSPARLWRDCIYLRGRRRRAARALEERRPEDFLVQWSADGKSIIVRGAEEQPLTLYRVDLASGAGSASRSSRPPDMTGFLEYHTGPSGVRITPDGRFYAYTFFTDGEAHADGSGKELVAVETAPPRLRDSLR